MATVELTAQDLEQQISEQDILLLDFWADWCGPCHQFAPIYEEASERHTDVMFGRIDTESEQQLAAELGIQSIPTLMAIREGVVVFSQPGVLPGEAIDELLEKVRELDMEEIHAELAQEGEAGEDESGETDAEAADSSER
ncbi:thiol reductase thioredoxin [Egibacter rhizosphaerae]|uniref:Thiol reductase thioredoxin n=1 Tax=Egibacter rhizosphaerae TaxID=1670831 RepID=A0A411YCY6_9ACTN|nr:thioredoxin domain-containing protein [Egibacter rhizosphaerae]QBI19060.1 thiol reductase thioredoxin [Egibacter rhizosphaerae]